MDEEGLDHLIRVIGLCQIPRDSWSDDDTQAFRDAREYVQITGKKTRESKREKASSGSTDESSEE